MSSVERQARHFISACPDQRLSDCAVSEALRHLGLSNRGFLEVDKLLDALGLEMQDDVASRDETIRRITTKSLHAHAVLARYPSAKVVEKVRASGFSKFRMYDHTQLWKQLNAKDEGSGYGCRGTRGKWLWFQKWVDEVLEHCAAAGETYR